jgi:hypothetical protein
LLRRALPVFILAALFATSTGFAATVTESVQSGDWSGVATWGEPSGTDATSSSVIINTGHTVTLGAGKSVDQGDALFDIFGHFVMEAESRYSGANLNLFSIANDDGDWIPGRLTLGSGATVNLTWRAIVTAGFFGTVEMAAGSHISLSAEIGGLAGWQNLVFDGNGQNAANAWISATMITMCPADFLVSYLGEVLDGDAPDYTGPWYNIELNGFGEGTWSLISGISTFTSLSALQQGGGMGTIDMSLLELITLSGDSAANATLGFNENTGTLYVTITASAVPEPAGYAALAGLALLAWVAMRRYRGARR